MVQSWSRNNPKNRPPETLVLHRVELRNRNDEQPLFSHSWATGNNAFVQMKNRSRVIMFVPELSFSLGRRPTCVHCALPSAASISPRLIDVDISMCRSR